MGYGDGGTIIFWVLLVIAVIALIAILTDRVRKKNRPEHNRLMSLLCSGRFFFLTRSVKIAISAITAITSKTQKMIVPPSPYPMKCPCHDPNACLIMHLLIVSLLYTSHFNESLTISWKARLVVHSVENPLV